MKLDGRKIIITKTMTETGDIYDVGMREERDYGDYETVFISLFVHDSHNAAEQYAQRLSSAIGWEIEREQA